MERIHVTVRARPLSAEDAKSSPWKISANSIFSPISSSKFEFDRIFGEDCKTVQVYDARTKDIVAAAIRGFNGTVFAYGQTNSGKTYTIRGSPSEPGIIPLSVHDLFHNIQQDVDREFLLRMSYMEIYNEEINDLLVPEHRKLQIHESLERGIYVAGLREEIVASPEQVLDLMEFGESHRHIGETNMNLYSSRSHTIFRMILESRHKIEDGGFGNSCDAVRVSVLNLVDLAGSERVAKTGAEGVRLKEGSHINKSLMTLGTVIKKLSEGAESQGGHVPYRDSKLTRILQPALGGNANTAIICNITLAQVHADETKSSLQFASRALRVTNCAQVNEILTDAALLKRQKKEIEELRAKLQGSQSGHLEEEILSLRNTLLQIELERERIALELEEEKKAQAEYEKRVQEQAKKIENLSSMVLYSSRDENRDRSKKGKRRDTWCPGNLARDPMAEVYSAKQWISSTVKPTNAHRYMGPLHPFQELMEESGESESDSYHKGEIGDNFSSSTYEFPAPIALMHVTNRRKVAPRKKNLPDDVSEYLDIQAAYEDLFVEFESQKTVSDIEADCLMRKLGEIDSLWDVRIHDNATNDIQRGKLNWDKCRSLRESEAILVIKRLQEQINILEIEKSSIQQSLDSVVELATEHNICAQAKFDELYEELLTARNEARRSHERLDSADFDGSSDFVSKLSLEVQEVISEVETLKNIVGTNYALIDEDFKTLTRESCQQQKLVIHDYKKLNNHFLHKVSELVKDKHLLIDQSVDLQKQIDVLRIDGENCVKLMTGLSELQNSEKEEYLSYIETLEKEISNLSSSFLVKEKESLRKELEKTRVKLKETESKLKNVMQEKTKLEGEKALAEREIKRLHGLNSLLERDMSKRDSMIDRRSSKLFDPKRSKGVAVPFERTLQEDYKKLEVFAFELETKVASLEIELGAVSCEKEELIFTNERLVSEFEALVEKMNVSNSELNVLLEEVSALKQKMEESKVSEEKLQSSIKLLEDSREELSMQLTDSLLQMEEERAIWSAKEKACVQAVEEKAKLHHMEITSLSKELLEVRNDLESCREELKVLVEKLTCAEEIAKSEKENRMKCMNEWNNTEKAKLRMRLRGTQAQLDAYKTRYMKSVEESNLMNKKYEESVAKLKDRLAASAKEVLYLKDRLAASANEVLYLKDRLAATEMEVLNLKKQLSTLLNQ